MSIPLWIGMRIWVLGSMSSTGMMIVPRKHRRPSKRRVGGKLYIDRRCRRNIGAVVGVKGASRAASPVGSK
jgi:hypothetical protein